MGVCAAASQNFDVRGGDWGFTQFVGHEDVYSQSKGFQQNGTVLLRVEIQVESPDSYLEAEKKRTGYVGLKNQGATCYMNSLLQTLYNINIFRQVTTSFSKSLCFCSYSMDISSKPVDW